MSNCRRNSGRRPVNRHLADAFRSVRTGIVVWKFDELDVNIWCIRGRRDNVVCELVVLHRAAFEYDVFIKGESDSLSNATFDLRRSERGIKNSAAFHRRDEIRDT